MSETGLTPAAKSFVFAWNTDRLFIQYKNQLIQLVKQQNAVSSPHGNGQSEYTCPALVGSFGVGREPVRGWCDQACWDIVGVRHAHESAAQAR